jgi:hypothetical protein
LHGAAFVPQPVVSLPVGATNTPSASEITHASAEGSFESGKQAPLHTWYVASHVMPHVDGAVHVACPCVGAVQTFEHEPQCTGCVESTHWPLHVIAVAASHEIDVSAGASLGASADWSAVASPPPSALGCPSPRPPSPLEPPSAAAQKSFAQKSVFEHAPSSAELTIPAGTTEAMIQVRMSQPPLEAPARL